jgi:mono/diheme cytochrome c family protein
MKMRWWSLLALVGCAIEPRGPIDLPPPPPPEAASRGAPISGGTLLVTRGGRYAVAADPDRDRVVVVEVALAEVAHEIRLDADDEPGRVVEDGMGRIHVALRRGGAIVTLDPATGEVLGRRPVCPEPRGIAWSAADDAIHVACVDGALVSFPAAGGDASRRLVLDRDLRDVVVTGDQLHVSTFRTAELITLDAQGNVVARSRPPAVQRSGLDADGVIQQLDAHPSIAWRTIGLPDGRVVMSHQRHLPMTLRTEETGGYGGGECGRSIVENAITVFSPGQPPFATKPFPFGSLAVDLAAAPAGDVIGLALAGSHEAFWIVTLLDEPDEDECEGVGMPLEHTLDSLYGPPTSVAFGPGGIMFVSFYPDAAVVSIEANGYVRKVQLPGQLGHDPGRDLFHSVTGVGIACASCHPEGREDGRVWEFAGLGPRRTQSVAGGILHRAPYHWSGDQVDLSALLDEVFVVRMAGSTPSPSQRAALGEWLDRLPPPAPIAGDPSAVARGQEIFESPTVGCVQCHNGPLFSNNQLVDVGTGGRFKVPSLLGVAARAPYLHTGCAPTLLARLTDPCGGGDQHGATSQLSPDQLLDLVAYLESL